MFTTIKRHAWLTSTLRLVPIIAIGVAAMIAMAPADAQAGFVVKTFACASGTTTVKVDVSGLGSQNVCVVGDVDLDLFCACENSGGNCPNAANKELRPAAIESSVSIQPKNGRVRADVPLVLPNQNNDSFCTSTAPPNVSGTALTCPGGQTAALVGFILTTDASFTLRKTNASPGATCTCPFDGEADLATTTCAASGTETKFGDVGDDCKALFP